MEATASGASRAAVLRAAVARVPADELVSALARASAADGAPKAAGNALNALRRHRDPASVIGRPQYRAALPVLAASVADECLTKTVEVLGDHSENPTKEQLLEALSEVRGQFPDATVAVMLASVANGNLPSSDLCAEVLAEDESLGLSGVAEETPPPPEGPGRGGGGGPTPEQRAARRAKRERSAAERRKRAEATRLANEKVRRLRKPGHA